MMSSSSSFIPSHVGVNPIWWGSCSLPGFSSGLRIWVLKVKHHFAIRQ